jgi:hypothetical protein
MPEIRILFERLVGTCVESVELSSDSQLLMTKRVSTSLPTGNSLLLANRALDGFKAAGL